MPDRTFVFKPVMEEIYVVQKRRSTNSEALKLLNVRSSAGIFYITQIKSNHYTIIFERKLTAEP